MPMRADAPSPMKKPSEKLNASGGKSKAMAGLKFSAPLTMTASVVTRLPTQSVTVRRLIESMRRYSSAMFTAPITTAIATPLR